jgi:hypothetical protein
LCGPGASCQKDSRPGPGKLAEGWENMRLLLRIVGTTLLAAALILLILDGTRSLGENALVMTSLGSTWEMVHADSLQQVRAFLATRFFGPLLETVVNAVLSFPGWAVLGVPGIVLAWLGRSKRTRVFVKQNQI